MEGFWVSMAGHGMGPVKMPKNYIRKFKRDRIYAKTRKI